MSCVYTYKNKEYSEQEILDLLKQENKSFWNKLTRTGLGLLTPETKEAILNEASKKYGIARGESKTTTKYSQVQQNEINYALKAVDILQSAKGDEIFRKGDKNNWNIDKILQELQVPKNQQDLIKSFNTKNREEIITNLLANYSYTVEINTAKDKVIQGVYISTLGSKVSSMENRYGKYYYTDEREVEIQINKTDWETAKQIFDEFQKGNNKGVPTQHYSNLTVPGGTNYTENEIATPLITPSIKGHAQFATDNGIGWFRSDDKAKTVLKNYYTEYIEALNKYVVKSNINDKITTIPGAYSSSESAQEQVDKMNKPSQIRKLGEEVISSDGKTRRILEVQSDLFQKGRDLDELNKGRFIIRDSFTNELYGREISKSGAEIMKADLTKTWDKSFYIETDTNERENQFLQLLNKDNNWVTFFIKSIIQDSAKKGYEKVLFPTGNTASKVEGHTTLEEFKKQKEDRIKDLEQRKEAYKIKAFEEIKVKEFSVKNEKEERVDYALRDGVWQKQKITNEGQFKSAIATNDDVLINYTKSLQYDSLDRLNTEITQLKQELERVETEGFGALKPIYNFYENTVTNILNKTFGKENVKVITDEYGNTWNEIDLFSEKVKQQTNRILFQSPKLQYTGDLAIEEKIAEEAENSKDEIVAKTLLQKFIQSIKNLLRNIFKEKDKISRLLRDINQGRLNSNSSNNNSQGIKYQLSKEQSDAIDNVFDENPELANAIYSALGFGKNNIRQAIIQVPTTLNHYSTTVDVFDEYKNKIGVVDIQKRGDGWVSLHPKLTAKGYGESLYSEISEYYTIVESAESKSGQGNKLWEKLRKKGVVDDGITGSMSPNGDPIIQGVIKTGTFKLNNQITPQQTQQAKKVYQQYINSLLTGETISNQAGDLSKSQVKDVLFNGKNLNQKNKTDYGFYGDGFYFSNGIELSKMYGDTISFNLLNIKAPKYMSTGIAGEFILKEIYDNLDEKYKEYYKLSEEYSTHYQLTKSSNLDDDTFFKNITDSYIKNTKFEYDSIIGPDSTLETDYNEYVVFNNSQIHILGNKQDIEQAKEFISKQNNNQTLNVYVNPEFINEQHSKLPDNQRNDVKVDISKDINYFSNKIFGNEQKEEKTITELFDLQDNNKPNTEIVDFNKLVSYKDYLLHFTNEDVKNINGKTFQEILLGDYTEKEQELYLKAKKLVSLLRNSKATTALNNLRNNGVSISELFENNKSYLNRVNENLDNIIETEIFTSLLNLINENTEDIILEEWLEPIETESNVNNALPIMLEDIIDNIMAQKGFITEFSQNMGLRANATFEEVKEKLSKESLESLNQTLSKLNPGLIVETSVTTRSQFDPNTNTITLNLPEIFALSKLGNMTPYMALNFVMQHELVHAQTSFGLLLGDLSLPFEKLLKDIIKQHKINPFIDEKRGGYEYNGIPYSFINVAELIADMHSNPQLVKWLKSNYIDGISKKTFFDKIVELIHTLLSKVGINIHTKQSIYDLLSTLINEKELYEKNSSNAGNIKEQTNMSLVVYGAATTMTNFEVITKAIKTEEVATIIKEKVPQIRKDLANIRKALNKVKTVDNIAANNIIKDIISQVNIIAENPEKVSGIIQQVFSVISVFQDLEKQINLAEFIEDPEERAATIYNIKDIDDSAANFKDTFNQIIYELERFKSPNQDTILKGAISSVLSEENINQNERARIEFKRILQESNVVSNRIQKIYDNLVNAPAYEIFYNQVEPVAIKRKNEILDSIAKMERGMDKLTPSNQLKEKEKIKKEREKIKKLPLRENNNIQEFVTRAQKGDTNWIDTYLQSPTVSANFVTQVMSGMDKEAELRVQNTNQELFNLAYVKEEEYKAAKGVTNFDEDKMNKPFIELLTITDEVTYDFETKDWKVTSHQQKGLVNNYTDEYQMKYLLFQKQLEYLHDIKYEKENANKASEIEALEDKIKKEQAEFRKKYVESKFIKELDAAYELLDEDLGNGLTLRKYNKDLYNKENEAAMIVRLFEKDSEGLKSAQEDLEEIRRQIIDKSSLYGKEEGSIEYKIAVQARKYSEAMEPHREYIILPESQKLYEENLADIDAKLKAKIIKEEDKLKWSNENQRAVISKTFWDRRQQLSDEVEEIRKKLVALQILPEEQKKEVDKNNYQSLKDIFKKYREYDGVINGKNVKDKDREEGKKIEEYLETLKKEVVKKGGLSINEQTILNNLNIKEERTPEEQEQLANLLARKEEASKLSKENKELVEEYKKAVGKLTSLFEGDTTRYYDEIMDSLNKAVEQQVKADLNKTGNTKENFIVIPRKDGNTLYFKKNDSENATEENAWIQVTEIDEVKGEHKYGFTLSNTNMGIVVKEKYQKEIINETEWYQQNHFDKLVWDEGINGYVTRKEPTYQWRKNEPKDKSFIKIQPSFKYSTAKIKESSLNPNYKETPSGLPMPKQGKYTNDKFNSLDNTDKDYLEFVRNMHYTTQINSGNNSAIIGDLLPSISKTSREDNITIIKNENRVDIVKQRLKEKFGRTDIDDQQGYVKSDNVQSKIIPTLGTGKIEAANQSSNIMAMVLQYVQYNETRKEKVKLEPTYQIMLSVVSKIEKQTKKGDKITKYPGIDSNIQKGTQEFINKSLYGEQRKDGLEFQTVNKILDRVMGFTAKKLFMFNIFSPIKNTISSKLQQYIDGTVDPKTGIKAQKEFTLNAGYLLEDTLKYGDKSKLGQMLDMFQGNSSHSFSRIFQQASRNKTLGTITDIPGAPKSISEFELQATFCIGMLMKYKVKTKTGEIISLYEAYEKDKTTRTVRLKDGITKIDGTKLTEKDTADYTQEILMHNMYIQGAYREEEKSSIEKTTGGRLAMFMTKYLVSGITKRWSEERYHVADGTFKKGYHRTFLKLLAGDYKLLLEGNFIPFFKKAHENFANMSVDEKIATMKTLREISVALVFFVAIAMMSGGDDDKDKSAIEALVLAQAMATNTEIQTFIVGLNTDEFVRKFNNPFVIARTFKNISKLSYQILQTITGDEKAYYQQDSGIYDKGDSKALATFMKIMGFGLSNVFFMDSKEQLKMQKSLLQVR